MEKNTTMYEIDIDSALNQINTVENYICSILENEKFSNFNPLQERKTDKKEIKLKDTTAEFITIDTDSLSPYSNLITEKEFFKIVGANSKRIYKTSGTYQERLYSNYIQAKQENDKGYIEDVLRKAIVFKYNLIYVKALMQNKKFMKEWRRNFGKLSPLYEFKRSGKLKKINIILNFIE